MQRLEKFVADEFRRQGITFTVYSEEAGTERIWPMDLFPRVIAAAEWDELARGLGRRVAALNCFLADLYCGEGAVIADGVVPRWLVGSGTAEVDAEVVIGRQVDAQPSVAASAPGRPGARDRSATGSGLAQPAGPAAAVRPRAG